MNLHRILLFGMKTTNAAPLSALPPSWKYLSFQDDNHQFFNMSNDVFVGYTFHFKMIITKQTGITHRTEVGYTFHFKMIITRTS